MFRQRRPAFLSSDVYHGGLGNAVSDENKAGAEIVGQGSRLASSFAAVRLPLAFYLPR